MGRETQRLSHIFAKVLQRHREAMKLSRQGLAERAGLHQTAVGLIERGLRTPNLDTLNALAKALQTDAWRLIRESESEMSKQSPSNQKIELLTARKILPKRRLPKRREK
jgi:transcriptional regulator with XRE-family HTH domain